MSERYFEYLDLDDLIDLATMLLGDPAPIRDMGLLGSAAARPQTTVFGEDAYPDLWTKAAALLHSVVKNHALIDGNKRLGWLATATFLEINGVPVTHITNDDVYDFVLAVTVGHDEIGKIADELRACADRRALQSKTVLVAAQPHDPVASTATSRSRAEELSGDAVLGEDDLGQ